MHPYSDLLRKLHEAGSACILWSCVYFEPALVDDLGFKELFSSRGPHCYADVARVVRDVLELVPRASSSVLAAGARGRFLMHQRGRPGAPDHCAPVERTGGDGVRIVEPDQTGEPMSRFTTASCLAHFDFIELVHPKLGGHHVLDDSLLRERAGGRQRPSKASAPRSSVAKRQEGTARRLTGPFRSNHTKMIGAAERRAYASTGKLMKDGAKAMGPSRGKRKREAPGPAYSLGRTRRTDRLARHTKSSRISFRALAGMTSSDRVRVGGAIGYLKNREGEKCPRKCGTTLRLLDTPGQTCVTLELNKTEYSIKTLCRYYCGSRGCHGNRTGFPVENDGKKTGIPLGGRGRAPAGEGILTVWLATQPWASAHPSVSDCTLIQGNVLSGSQVYLDECRRKMAALNIAEQKTMKFKRGQLVEWDECGVRARHVPCKSPCKLCGVSCIGYRLLYNRWIIGVVRSDRKYLVIGQLPFETCHGEGGGVPLSGPACDAFCLKYMTNGVINLTDGAGAYEAFAAGDIACSPTCERQDDELSRVLFGK